jgi:hypothetical protein
LFYLLWGILGKIDFIVCESSGGWYTTSFNVPDEIAVQSNDYLVDWAKHEKFNDEPDIIFVGVYWRDSLIDQCSGITQSSILKKFEKCRSSSWH